ncbi:geranylgeranyl transferase type-2 subunit alpha [Bombyx mandarina]|uniref:Geranylgeranyl transferase type-2 subunit alpha n=1 Tax=Bombyx mandarina TaxID=7092 RepID=A0A6J2KI49_BOMMA|nr:geranylgeranyl transferase type-2 subunit alpha [Bombyx mandarina]
MHGRVKVRTSEEEKARKEKERNEKLKIFKHAMQKIQIKRKECTLDKELLELAGNVLSSNPDIYTLWNIRREILQLFKKSNDNIEEMSQVYNAELHLTEYCLKINPKSYCAWHQREWVLLTRDDPDWQKELELCNTYLKLDERNFHTWDYRRFVVSQCKPSLKDEFDYTTEKLMDNFSNYSAWHYRSKMLVELYPDRKGGRPIEDSHHKHELKMVQNAAFTDPDDTSAWFYQRWLLGAVKTTIDLVNYTVTPTKTTFAFSKHVDKNYVSAKTKLLINNCVVNGEWVSCTGNCYDVLWVFQHSTPITKKINIKVEYEIDNGQKQIIQGVECKEMFYIGKNQIKFERNYSEAVIEELKDQLESCRQLLNLEPDSKWTMLTTTIFLHCIDAKAYHTESIQNLQKLKVIDKLRAGYYDDLIAKWCIEKQLCSDYENADLALKFSFPSPVSSLPYLQYYSYCDSVDLSNQQLTSNIFPSLIVLQHCKKLSLENNNLTTMKNFPDLDLVELNLLGNEKLDRNEIELFTKKYNFNIKY